MLGVLKSAGKKFFPAYIWLVTKVLCEQQEFKIALNDGRIGFYSYLTPLYAVFHNDDKTFSLMWTEFDDDFSQFYAAYMRDKSNFGDNHGILSKKDVLPPPNAYTVSCLPRISFRHFAVHNYENKEYYFPSVESGKFDKKDGKIFMPLSVTCHHAAADGWHLAQFLYKLQSEADNFERYI